MAACDGTGYLRIRYQVKIVANILFLYGATQTFTNTVYEHVSCFARYSQNQFYFCHQDQYQGFNIDLSRFDAVIVHYSVRLPYDQIPEATAEALGTYAGAKVLFIQDEYDHTFRTWYWIKRLGFQLVFTVVPTGGISKVYPPHEFPGVRFVSNLTGYVPDERPLANVLLPTSSRRIAVGYRGRPLPIRYGALGLEKIEIGRQVKRFCESNGIPHDISWAEEARIYGPQWYDFVASCRSTLGSESGSNVFDWDGTIAARIDTFRHRNGGSSDSDVYRSIVQPCELPGLMNQVSPRVFEAIALRTALLLYEGSYSGVIAPMRHFIPIEKDGSNLVDAMKLLLDDNFIEDMTERAYQEIILSGAFSYRSFVQNVDKELATCLASLSREISDNKACCTRTNYDTAPTPITTAPIRTPPSPVIHASRQSKLLEICGVFYIWRLLPDRARGYIRPFIREYRRLLIAVRSTFLALKVRALAKMHRSWH